MRWRARGATRRPRHRRRQRAARQPAGLGWPWRDEDSERRAGRSQRKAVREERGGERHQRESNTSSVWGASGEAGRAGEGARWRRVERRGGCRGAAREQGASRKGAKAERDSAADARRNEKGSHGRDDAEGAQAGRSSVVERGRKREFQNSRCKTCKTLEVTANSRESVPRRVIKMQDGLLSYRQGGTNTTNNNNGGTAHGGSRWEFMARRPGSRPEKTESRAAKGWRTLRPVHMVADPRWRPGGGFQELQLDSSRPLAPELADSVLLLPVR